MAAVDANGASSHEEVVEAFDVDPSDQPARASPIGSHCRKTNIALVCVVLVIGISVVCIVIYMRRAKDTRHGMRTTITTTTTRDDRIFCGISPIDLPGACSKFYGVTQTSDCCDAMVFFSDIAHNETGAKMVCDKCNSTSNEEIRAFMLQFNCLPETPETSIARKLAIPEASLSHANDNCTSPISPTCTLYASSDYGYLLSQVEATCCSELILSSFDFSDAWNPKGSFEEFCSACGLTKNDALQDFFRQSNNCQTVHLYH